MAVAYYYSSTAGLYTLTTSVTPSSAVINVDKVVGLPGNVPFKVVLDPGLTTEEIVKVTAMAGTSLTVTRAWDGTTASSHAAGGVVRHMMTAEDFTLSRAHEAATAAHGVTGAVVGTSDAQALTNKDLTGAGNVFPANLATLAGAQALTNKDLSGAGNIFPSSLVTLTGTQALTNKNLTGAGNVFPTTLATLAGAQVFTNKDLTSSTNTFPASLATLAGTQTLTGKTMSGASNTFTAIPQSAVTGLTTIQTNVNSLKADTGAVAGTTGFTAKAGWGIGATTTYRIVGSVCQLYLIVSRTGTPVTPPADTNIANIPVASVPAALVPSVGASGSIVDTGPLATVHIDTAGNVELVATAGTINTGDNINFSLTYLV